MTNETVTLDVQPKIRTILEELTREERQLLSRVLTAEQRNLYMQDHPGINEELWKALTDVIK
jgi:hypothetical protein